MSQNIYLIISKSNNLFLLHIFLIIIHDYLTREKLQDMAYVPIGTYKMTAVLLI